jgi:hypothetical protein
MDPQSLTLSIPTLYANVAQVSYTPYDFRLTSSTSIRVGQW